MKLVCAARFETPSEAFIAKGMLDDNGIEAIVDGATIASVLPLPTALGGVRLMVADTDLPRARELLEEHRDIY